MIRTVSRMVGLLFVASVTSALLDEPRYSENMQLLKRLVKYRAAAKAYLQYGRMLRPLVLEGAMPLVEFRMKESTLARHDAVARQTAVMSSVWEGVDGSLAVVLFNISGMEQVFKARLSANMYPILNECSELYSLMADGSELLCGRLESGALILEGKLGRDEVRILVAR